MGGFPLLRNILVFPTSTHSFFMVVLLCIMGVRAEPSLIRTLPSACGLSTLKNEVRTFPGCWSHSRSLGTLPVTGHTSPGGAYSLSSLRDNVQTLPGGCSHSPVTGNTPPVGACSLSSLRDEVWTLPCRCAQSPEGWQGGEETGAVAAGEFPKVPQRVFFLLGKILLLSPVAPSIQGRA